MGWINLNEKKMSKDTWEEKCKMKFAKGLELKRIFWFTDERISFIDLGQSRGYILKFETRILSKINAFIFLEI